MKKINLALIVAFLFVTQSFVLAERTLDRTEILQILRTITSNPRETWISSGTIQATHNTYNALTGQTFFARSNFRLCNGSHRGGSRRQAHRPHRFAVLL